MLCRTFLALLLASCTWKVCLSVMCYWCSGVGDDRDCETRPYAVRTGPVYLNCRANFCLSAKVIDAETGQVQSFARLCDNVPRGNLCIRDSKLLTCYESCTTDLCNNGNPSPLQLPTVSYAGEAQQNPGYQKGYSPIKNRDVLGRPYKSNSLKGARNIRFGPRRDMWLATPQHDFHSTKARRFPFIVTSTPGVQANPEFLKAGMDRNAGNNGLELIGDKKFVSKEFNTVDAESEPEMDVNQITSNPGTKDSVFPGNMKTTLPSQKRKDEDIPVVDRPKMATVPGEYEAQTENIKGKEGSLDYSASKVEERLGVRTHRDGADYMATMDMGYGERIQKEAGNDLQYIDGDENESFYEEELEVDRFGEIARGSDGLSVWPRRAMEEEFERQELRREDEMPVSNLIVEEDREEGLIQTFRANTTKTTENADKPEIEKKELKTEGNITKNSDVKESPVANQFNTTTDSTSTRVATTKKIPVDTTTLRNTVKQIKEMKMKEMKTNTMKSVNGTSRATTTPATRQTTTNTLKKVSTLMSKSKATIKLIQTKQTTLPYIWKETSAWNEDGTVVDRTHQATWTSEKSSDSTTKHVKATHHRDVHLTDFLELQSTTEPLVVNSSSNEFEPPAHPNKTSLAQRAPGLRDEGEIYLDESLTENLLGLKEDFQDKTQAGLTGSHSPKTSSSCLFLLSSLLIISIYIL